MKKVLMTFSLLAAAFASNLAAAPLPISTGSAAPWLVNGNPVVLQSPLAVSFWIGSCSDGKWVGTTSSDGNLAGGASPGTYTFSMNIGAYFGAAGVLSLQYAADNNVNWSITNGSLAGSTSCVTENCFSAVGGSPRSLTGSFSANSTLTATVVNTRRWACSLSAPRTPPLTFRNPPPTQ